MNTVPLTITAVAVPKDAVPKDSYTEDPDPHNPDLVSDLRECQALRDAHHLALWGNLDRCSTFREDREYWRGNEYEERLLYLARLDGVPVGSCSVSLPLRENTATAWIEVLVAVPHRRRGIGRQLLRFA